MIAGSDNEMITIPIDQLPLFLQEMAINDPDMFQQLIADMDEEKLSQFISEQENQSRLEYLQANQEVMMGRHQNDNIFDPNFMEEEIKDNE